MVIKNCPGCGASCEKRGNLYPFAYCTQCEYISTSLNAMEAHAINVKLAEALALLDTERRVASESIGEALDLIREIHDDKPAPDCAPSWLERARDLLLQYGEYND